MNSLKHLMGYRPQFGLGPTRFLREGLRGSCAKVRAESHNPRKKGSEVRNKQSRSSKQALMRNCLRSLSYVILRHMPTQNLRRTYAPSRKSGSPGDTWILGGSMWIDGGLMVENLRKTMGIPEENHGKMVVEWWFNGI